MVLCHNPLILGLPWLEKYNPIINWKEKTLEFQSSPEESAKMFIQSLIQCHEETMSEEIEDHDLMLWIITSHIELEPTDQLYDPFKYYQQDNNELHIRRYSPVQQMERFTLPHLRFTDSKSIPRNELGIRIHSEE